MPSSPQMSPAVLAMEEEFLRSDECASLQKGAKGAPDNLKCEDDSESVLGDVESELEATLSQTKSLEEELKEAESWAGEMQGIWDKTEAHWQEKITELTQRLEAAKNKASSTLLEKQEDHPTKDKTGAGNRREESESLAKEAEKLAKKAEARAVEANKLADELAAEIQAAEKIEKDAKADVDSLEAKLEQIQASVKEVTQSNEAAQEEVQMAATWADETTAKYEKEITGKGEELKALKEEVSASREACASLPADVRPQECQSKCQHNASKVKAFNTELLGKVVFLEGVLASEKERSQEFAITENNLKDANAKAIAKEAQSAKDEAERCGEVQKELESVNREIKSGRANSKAQASKRDAEPKKIEDLRKDEAASREAQQSAEQASDALAIQLKDLKAYIAAIPEEDRAQRMQQIQQAKKDAKLQEAKAKEEAKIAHIVKSQADSQAAVKLDKPAEAQAENVPSASISNKKTEAVKSATPSSLKKSAAQTSSGEKEKEIEPTASPAVPKTKAAKAAAREASRDAAAGRSSHKGNRAPLASKQTVIWGFGFVAAVQLALFVGKHLM